MSCGVCVEGQGDAVDTTASNDGKECSTLEFEAAGIRREAMIHDLVSLSSDELTDLLLEVAKARPEIMDTFSQGPSAAPEKIASYIDAAQEQDAADTGIEPVPIEPSPAECQILFCSSIFYALESEGHVDIHAMRLGPVDKPSAVQWHTCDGSAKAGKKYKAASGWLEFGIGEIYKTIQIQLIDNKDWDPTLDFFVTFERKGIQNATVHYTQLTCRVKDLDDDIFPTENCREELLTKGPEGISGRRLMFEYIKMNWKNEVVRRGSIKCFLLDLLSNCKYIFTLLLGIILVDKIILPVLQKEEEFEDSKQIHLVLVALGYLLPDFLIHYFQYRRNFWKVGGASRKVLQTNLVRMYMNYPDTTRLSIEPGDVMISIFSEVHEVVNDGYCSIFPLVRNFVQVIFIIFFQLFVLKAFSDNHNEKEVLISLGLFIVFPTVMLPFLVYRERKTGHLVGQWKTAQAHARTTTIDMVNNFYLLKDYFKRFHATDVFQDNIDKVNGSLIQLSAARTNTKFFPRALATMVIAGWVWGGGLLVIKSDLLDLGVFLASLQVFGQIGNSWGDIYDSLEKMQATLVKLRKLTQLLNLPTEDEALCKFERHCEDMTRKRFLDLKKVHKSGESELVLNEIPLEFHKLSYAFVKTPVFQNVSLTFVQGKLHAISSPRGMGKALLLQLIGRRLLMTSFEGEKGHVFVPTHLKVRHVSKEPLFIMGTLYENLTYGVPRGDLDMRVERALSICTQLGIPEETLSKISEQPDAEVLRWNGCLPLSTRHLLNMARGLISNAEVLVIHKPTADLGPRTRPTVLKALRTFVDSRGLQNNPNLFHQRRPRTCIISVRPDEDVSKVDYVHWPLSDEVVADD